MSDLPIKDQATKSRVNDLNSDFDKALVSTISKNLLQARKKAGYTQREVCKTLGIKNVQSLSAYERGRQPSLALLVRLCSLYKTSYEEILGQVPVFEDTFVSMPNGAPGVRSIEEQVQASNCGLYMRDIVGRISTEMKCSIYIKQALNLATACDFFEISYDQYEAINENMISLPVTMRNNYITKLIDTCAKLSKYREVLEPEDYKLLFNKRMTEFEEAYNAAVSNGEIDVQGNYLPPESDE